jgi:acyl-coenzyme A synthetase/AMP-(fatty) acid ligase
MPAHGDLPEVPKTSTGKIQKFLLRDEAKTPAL